MITVEPIGIVKNKFKEPADPFLMRESQSKIIIDAKFEEGLYRIEESAYIDVTFHFHKSEGYNLKGAVYDGQVKGVFASRSPRRPSSLGNSTVKLLSREGNKLIVSGLDAIDGTPVLDIKPCNTSFFEEHGKAIHVNRLKHSPRWEITRFIKNNSLDSLLLEAGKLHGHFCSGLALGVMAATYAMQKISEFSDGMEDIIAITETNNCFSDGIQFVTGCTFGNNALIFKDIGKNAFTLAARGKKGIRIVLRNDSADYLQEKYPRFYDYFHKVVVERINSIELKAKLRKSGIEASFGILHSDFEKIFHIQEVTPELPGYAPIHDNVICAFCGEKTMSTRITEKDNYLLCLTCAKEPYGMLTGFGIKEK
ncbi:MAG: SAM-dependent methyltransferase [Bacteroidales bacterium]|nr:SAM-dependent methyltransferase [Bacteroidales bacterium]